MSSESLCSTRMINDKLGCPTGADPCPVTNRFQMVDRLLDEIRSKKGKYSALERRGWLASAILAMKVPNEFLSWNAQEGQTEGQTYDALPEEIKKFYELEVINITDIMRMYDISISSKEGMYTQIKYIKQLLLDVKKRAPSELPDDAKVFLDLLMNAFREKLSERLERTYSQGLKCKTECEDPVKEIYGEVLDNQRWENYLLYTDAMFFAYLPFYFFMEFLRCECGYTIPRIRKTFYRQRSSSQPEGYDGFHFLHCSTEEPFSVVFHMPALYPIAPSEQYEISLLYQCVQDALLNFMKKLRAYESGRTNKDKTDSPAEKNGWVLKNSIAHELFRAAEETHLNDTSPNDLRYTITLNYNQRPLMVLPQTNHDGATTASGCKVGVYGDTSDAVFTQNGIFTTDSNGKIEISGLIPGGYIISEIKAPQEQGLDRSSNNEVVAPNNDDHSIIFFARTPGSLVIKRKDPLTDEPLEGVTIKISASTGKFVPDKKDCISSKGHYKADRNGIPKPNITGQANHLDSDLMLYFMLPMWSFNPFIRLLQFHAPSSYSKDTIRTQVINLVVDSYKNSTNSKKRKKAIDNKLNKFPECLKDMVEAICLIYNPRLFLNKNPFENDKLVSAVSLLNQRIHEIDIWERYPYDEDNTTEYIWKNVVASGCNLVTDTDDYIDEIFLCNPSDEILKQLFFARGFHTVIMTEFEQGLLSSVNNYAQDVISSQSATSEIYKIYTAFQSNRMYDAIIDLDYWGDIKICSKHFCLDDLAQGLVPTTRLAVIQRVQSFLKQNSKCIDIVFDEFIRLRAKNNLQINTIKIDFSQYYEVKMNYCVLPETEELKPNKKALFHAIKRSCNHIDLSSIQPEVMDDLTYAVLLNTVFKGKYNRMIAQLDEIFSKTIITV